MSNKMRLVKFVRLNKLFLKCCELAGCEPTIRQASKFRNRSGRAFEKKDEAIRLSLLKNGIVKSNLEDN